ncbi:MAG: ATP-dependent metallopeptidase FtsH/Yme1/Tma family protein, partial [Anaerolineae bacterium]|nr:ATP-dependent metallopeptidase FtsH/Yme1/Tma family protein [Anaerolineae bacterium]
MEKKDRKPDSDDEKERQEQMARQMRYGITYILVGLVVLWLFQQFVLGPLTVRALEIPYSEFRQKLADGDIVRVEISPSQIRGEMKNPDFPGDVDAAIAAATVAPA